MKQCNGFVCDSTDVTVSFLVGSSEEICEMRIRVWDEGIEENREGK